MPTEQTRNEKSLVGRIGAHESWARTEDRPGRTAAARAALAAKFLAEAGGDPVRAGHLRKAHCSRMALASARARRKVRELQLIREAEAAEAELEAAETEAAGGNPA